MTGESGAGVGNFAPVVAVGERVRTSRSFRRLRAKPSRGKSLVRVRERRVTLRALRESQAAIRGLADS